MPDIVFSEEVLVTNSETKRGILGTEMPLKSCNWSNILRWTLLSLYLNSTIVLNIVGQNLMRGF